MISYNVNFRDIIFKITPNFKRATNFISLLYSIIKPLKDLNTNVSYSAYSAASTYAIGDKVVYQGINYSCIVAIVAPESFTSSKWMSLGTINDFFTTTDNLKTLLAFDSRIIYFEKYLNDKYDSTLRRIYITNGESNINYVFNDAESATPIYLYNNWDSTISYIIDDRIVDSGVLYVCILGNTNIQPPNATYWTAESLSFYYNKGGSLLGYDFTVNVPTGLLGASQNQFEADVEQYKLAGKTWNLVTF